MRRHLFFNFIFLLATLCPFADTHAQEIAVVRSAGLKPHDEVLRGFKSSCKATTREFVLSEQSAGSTVNEILKIKPDLILAVGMNALAHVKKIRDIPIVYALVSNPQAILSGEKNITGVSMNISPEKQFRALLEIAPQVKRLGLVYDPQKTAQLLSEAQYAASSLGITVVSQKVFSAKEVPSAINRMKGRVDAFWVLPDTTVVTQESLEYLLLFSLENKLPTLAFSDKYVEFGFLMALNIDALDIGRQAADMANRILKGADTSAVPMAAPEKNVVFLNRKTARWLGLRVSDDLIRRSEIIR
jgi:putative ABC transport system substrate-binding protein